MLNDHAGRGDCRSGNSREHAAGVLGRLVSLPSDFRFVPVHQ
jgi:hypothetical protein